MAKMNVNLYVIEDYENEPPSGPKKTNPISTTPKGVKQKYNAGSQRSDICLLPSVFCKRFDFNGLLGYNSANKVTMGPEEVI